MSQTSSSSNTYLLVPIVLIAALTATAVIRGPSLVTVPGLGSAIAVAAPLVLATYALMVLAVAGRGTVDLAIGPLAFVKRIKVNGFFDYGRRENDSPFTGSNQFSSTGLELRFDVRLLRLVEADLGLRYSYLLNAAYAPQGKVHQFDFLVISISN